MVNDLIGIGTKNLWATNQTPNFGKELKFSDAPKVTHFSDTLIPRNLVVYFLFVLNRKPFSQSLALK